MTATSGSLVVVHRSGSRASAQADVDGTLDDVPSALPPTLVDLITRQSGVVSRRQAVDHGLGDHDVRRLLRRREWAAAHRGVYVTHTGPPTWLQHAWAAVLGRGPAALFGPSAIRATERALGGLGTDEVLHVAVDRHHGAVADRDRVHVHHVSRLNETVLWHAAPPRQRYEEAVLDVALAAPDRLSTVAALARACSTRRTTPARLRVALAGRPNAADRAAVLDLLRDVEEGTCSALEHAYLTRVERPHGLPRAVRQQRGRGRAGVVYRDAAYRDEVYVELDGVLFHEGVAHRDRDHERDLDALVEGRRTARLTWGQVFDRPCRTALQVGRLLQRSGVTAPLRACGPSCEVTTAVVAPQR